MNLKNRMRSIRLGVTLVEVLIVISIIVALAGLFLVMGGQIKGKARELKCRSHLSQLTLAIKRYRMDHAGGRFPPVRRYGEPGEEGWVAAISPYLSSKDVLVCPNDWKLASSPDGRADEGDGAYRTTSYDYLPRHRIEHSDVLVYYSTRWVDVFRKRGDATPLLRCPYHDKELFVRVNIGGVETAARASDWTQW